MEENGEASYLSQRGQATLNFPNFMQGANAEVAACRYDKNKNPKGIIDLGLAESSLCEDILLSKFKDQDKNSWEWEPYMLQYADWHGLHSFRQTVANFITERFKTCQPVKPENLIVSSGVGAAIDYLAHALADPGDAFLIPAPYYPRISTDFGERSMVKCINFQLSSKMTESEIAPFQLTVGKLEKAYHDAVAQGERVRGLILLNPNNPTGDIYNPPLLRDILNFCHRYKLHLIVDEIFALSVYAKSATFTSVLALPDIPDPMRTHVLWGFSKDFTLAGLRVGIIHSFNKYAINAIKPMSYFGSVPPMIQQRLALLLEDTKWLDNVYFPTNLQRMREAYKYCKDRLEPLGVDFFPSKATYFAWVDMSKFIQPRTKEKQMNLYRKFLDAGVCIFPGPGCFQKEVGWFRIVYTHKREFISVALDRIVSVLESSLFSI